ncbi:hypothetical protein U1Q18_041823 [Sarracenia purpurea var. burkii]
MVPSSKYLRHHPNRRNTSVIASLKNLRHRNSSVVASSSPAPFVSHPREVREIPIEVKDGDERSGHSSLALIIEDVTGIAQALGPEIHGTIIIEDDADEDIFTASSEYTAGQNEQIDGVLGNNSCGTYPRPSAPEVCINFVSIDTLWHSFKFVSIFLVF